MWTLGTHQSFDYEVVTEKSTIDSHEDCDVAAFPREHNGRRQHLRPSVVILMVLITNVLTALGSYLLSNRTLKSIICDCVGNVQPASMHPIRPSKSWSDSV